MKPFCFRITKQEHQVRTIIDDWMKRDVPKVGVFGDKRWTGGIHFTRNDDIIEGLHFHADVEKNRTRGVPNSSCFRGRICVDGQNGLFFRGWIYPNPWPGVLGVLLILIALRSEFAAIGIYLLFADIFDSFILIRENYKLLEELFTK